MKRKVIELGKNCLVTSLPAKWVKQQNIKKGDDIDIIEAEGNLHISSGSMPVIRQGTLNVTDFGLLSRRAIDAMYKSGYDEIKISYSDQKDMQAVEQAIDLEAMSFEIVEQGKGYCIVRSISEPNEKEFDTILRRTLLLLKSMGEGILNALKQKDAETLRQMKNLEKTNNKFTHFLRRYLNKYGYREQNRTIFLYTIVESLEKIADEFKFLCDYISDDKRKDMKISPEIFAMFAKVNSSISLFYESFYQFDTEKARLFAEIRKEVVNEAHKQFDAKPSRSLILVHYLLNIEQMLYDMFGPYLAMIL